MKKETITQQLLLWIIISLVIGPMIGAAQPVNAKPISAEQAEGISSVQQTTATCAFATSANVVYLPLVNSGVSSSPQTMDRSLRYQVGKTYIYDYQMSTYSVFGAVSKEEGVQAKDPSTILMYGQALISITGMEGDDVFVGSIVLSSPTICQQNPDGPDVFMENSDILADLATPVLFKQKKSGEILDVQVAETVDPNAANYLKTILNSLQATLSEEDVYTAEESGGQGVYTAQYANTLQQDGLHLEKTLTDESFTEFYSQGDLPGVILNNKIDMLLDRALGVFSYATFNEMTDVLTADPDSLNPDEIEGVAVWGNTRSTGTLKLNAVEDTPPQLVARAAGRVYQSTGLAAYLGDIEQPTYGIDLTTLDLEAELDAYMAAAADNLDAYLRMRRIMKVDAYDPASHQVLDAISDRIMNNLTDEEGVKKLVDLLGSDGSSTAQATLRRLIDPTDALAARIPAGVRTQVFANMPLLTDPQPDTYNLMPLIMDSSETTDEQKSMAMMAWGTMGAALAETDADMSDAIYKDLTSRLAAATPEETTSVLRALGNTGNAGLPDLLAPYLPFTDPNVDEGVQAAAFWALRLVPGQKAEDLLIKAVDDDGGTVYPVPKDTAAMALKNRPGKPSDNANDVLAGYDHEPPQPGGSRHWSWNQIIGDKRMGGSLPGSAVIETASDSINAQAAQEARFHLKISRFNYSKEGSLASITVWSKPHNNTVQKFGYATTLFDKDYADVEYNAPCGDSDSDVIQSGKSDIFDTSFEYPVYAFLKVGTKLTAVASYSLKYDYNWSLCNPTDLSAGLTVTGDAKLHASAYGYAKVTFLRGGPKLEADIMSIKIPANVSGTYTAQDGFEVCGYVPATIKALSGAFHIYAEWWVIKWVEVYDYSPPAWNFTLVEKTFELTPQFCN